MKLQVIVGSTRPGRVSDRIAKWVVAEAQTIADVTAELVDLSSFELPFFDEPISPQYNPDRKPTPVVQAWLQKVAEADAYVIITPEYNRSIPAVLKNALDYLDFQMMKKPVAILAHGSTGGAQAAAHLRGIIPGLNAVSVPSATFLVGRAAEMIDGQGTLGDEHKQHAFGPEGALKRMLEDTKWYSDALAAARK